MRDCCLGHENYLINYITLLWFLNNNRRCIGYWRIFPINKNASEMNNITQETH